jgi:hypothetical protein
MFRNAIETQFGKRRGQEKAKSGSWSGLINMHGQEHVKNRSRISGLKLQQSL